MSDLDLVVVTRARMSIQRIHSDWIDLNLLTICDLASLARRIEQGEQLPWDAMFEDVIVADDPTGLLGGILGRLRGAYASALRDLPNPDPLRFLVQRQLKALAEPKVGLLVGTVRVATALALVAAVNGSLRQASWRGGMHAMRSLEAERPDVSRMLHAAVSASPDWLKAAEHIREAGRLLLDPAGGLWERGSLVLRSDIAVVTTPHEGMRVNIADLEKALEQVTRLIYGDR